MKMSKYCSECGRKLESKDMHIIFVLDESGSMSSIWDSTIDAVNEYFNAQKLEEGETWVTLTKFDTEFRPLYNYTPLDEVAPLNRETFRPRGLTALHDAIGKTLNEYRSKKDVRTVFVIMTDGRENASNEYTLASVKPLIDSKKKDGWDFVFLGANIDSYAVGGAYGFNTTVNWSPTNLGVQTLTRAVGSYSTAYRNTGETMTSACLQNLVDDKKDN
jgi:hypothetical protein